MENYKGIEYFRRQLSLKRNRVLLRYKYYEMKHTNIDPGNVIPGPLKMAYNSVLGWCAKSVDCLADRLVFDQFESDNFDLNMIFKMNNPDTLFDSAVLSAIISSCCFIYISLDESNYPRLQVIDGANATGELDPITGLLKEGYAVLARDDNQNILIEAYFTAGSTTYIDKTNPKNPVAVVSNIAEFPLLVPIIYKPDAMRVFGHSRISRACMNLQSKACSTITRADVAAEFYSFPQKYIIGVSDNAEAPMDIWKATISSMLTITKDDDGDSPKVGQFTQQSMEPHISQFKMLAAAFAGETGLTMDDLGFATDNPSSVDAIRAAHENLRLTARKAQRTFGSGLLNAGFLAACLRDNFPYQRKQLYLTTPIWQPIFEPDAAMLSGIGDGAIKINQAVPGYFGADNLKKLTGIPTNGVTNGGLNTEVTG